MNRTHPGNINRSYFLRLLPVMLLSLTVLLLTLTAFTPLQAAEAEEVELDGRLSDRPDLILGALTPPINAAAWSPGEELLASPGAAGDIIIWSEASGRVEKILSGHEDEINSLAWSPEGEILISTSQDGTARSWRVETGENLAIFREHDDWVLSASIDPAGEMAVSGGWDSSVRIWNIETGQELAALDSPGGWVRSVSWSPEGDMLAAGTNNRAFIWDYEEEELIHTLGRSRTRIRALAWLDSESLALGNDDGQLLFYDNLRSAGAELRQEKNLHSSRINSLRLSPDGGHLAAAGNFKEIYILDAGSGEITAELEGHGHYVTDLSWSADSRRLASVSEDNRLKIWQADSGEVELTLNGHRDQISTISFSPSGDRIVTGSEDNRLRLFRPPSPSIETVFTGHTAPVLDVDWSADGSRLASAGEDKAVIIWDADSTDSPARPKFVAGDHREPLLDWDVFRPAGRDKTTHEDWVFSTAFDRNEAERYLATASYDGSAALWMAEDGNPWQQMSHEKGWVRQVVWVPGEEKLISIGQSGGIHLWNTEGELLEQHLQDGPELRAAAFTPDGRHLALSSYDDRLRLLSYPEFEVIDELPAHEGLIFDLVWSPGGEYLATAGEDLNIKIWSLKSGGEGLEQAAVRQLPGYSGRPPRTLDWSEDDSYIASHDGTYLLFWALDSTR